MQSFYRRQRAAGGVIGPEGVGWPRFQVVGAARDSVGRTFLPPEVRAECAAKDGGVHSAGMAWPRPTPILLAEGDAVIALQNVPHSSSVNLGPDPRMNVYFRLRVDRPPLRTARGQDQGDECHEPHLTTLTITASSKAQPRSAASAGG